MKTDLSYLPENKQSELLLITEIIQKATVVEMIILFGSYARNDWVEDKYNNSQYRYQSDFDMLVIIENTSEFAQAKLERELEYQIDQKASINTPVSILVHDIEFVNRRLSKAQYFFTDIKKEGILLFNSEKYQLKESKELLLAERKKLAEEDLKYYFNEASEFKEGVDFYFEKKRLNKAAFLLHQMAERLYTSILMVFTRYKPNTHNLEILRKLANTLDNRLNKIFLLDNAEEHHLFKLLCKSYVDARYKPSFKITKDELGKLIDKVNELKKIGHQLCLEKIESFNK